MEKKWCKTLTQAYIKFCKNPRGTEPAACGCSYARVIRVSVSASRVFKGKKRIDFKKWLKSFTCSDTNFSFSLLFFFLHLFLHFYSTSGSEVKIKTKPVVWGRDKQHQEPPLRKALGSTNEHRADLISDSPQLHTLKHIHDWTVLLCKTHSLLNTFVGNQRRTLENPSICLFVFFSLNVITKCSAFINTVLVCKSLFSVTAARRALKQNTLALYVK